MNYPEEFVTPMRQELTELGIKELKTIEEVDQALSKKGTNLLVINSVCGCAAGNARPAINLALQHNRIPDHLYTVFAGQEKEATQQARKYLMPYPPSSPAIALLKDGKLVEMIERHQIEGKPAELIAQALVIAFDKHC